MKKVLFIVPEGYESISGIKLPVTQYQKAMEGNVELIMRTLSYHASKEDVEQLAVESNGNPDIIITYGLNQAYPAIKYIKQSHEPIEAIAVLMDSNTLYAKSVKRDIGKNKSSFLNKIKYELKYNLYRHKEGYCLANANKVMYVSEVDKKYVTDSFPCIRAKLYVIGNGIETTGEASLKSHDLYNIKLGFISTFTEAVIEENLKPIVESLMPELMSRKSAAKLIVAGRGMEKELGSYLSRFDYVEYIGSVDQLSSFYDMVDVVVPLTMKPGGILNKIMEAWTYKKCVIAYDYNFIAFPDAISGKHYLSGKNYVEIAEALLDIQNGKIDIDKIGCSAYDLVRSNYTWDKRREQFVKMIME